MTLLQLKPGRRFAAAEAPELCGVLVRCNDCRAVVRLDRPPKFIVIRAADGREACFERPEREQSVTPHLQIVPR